MNEADTCRRWVVPALQTAGWDSAPHLLHEQATVTDGRIVPVGDGFVRKRPKKVDYLLSFERGLPLAVVEAKADYKTALDGLQQAKDYAELLGLRFAYATNGPEIVEFDYKTGVERFVTEYPSPQELWRKYHDDIGLAGAAAQKTLLATPNASIVRDERYYQRIAVTRTLEAILRGRDRLLLTMATGTGKTTVAYQLCWKLWSSRWTRNGVVRRPRILYLADLSILIDQPIDGLFAAFGDARIKVESGRIPDSREIYFSTYQAIAEDERRTGRFRELPRDFFDLVIVDECHRGSAREDSAWRAILEHFSGAVQLGMTATPVRSEAADSYEYFGEPVFEYSLKQGIEDGFLAPYRVHRVVTEWDATGWRPSLGDLDRYGREIPEGFYETRDFERTIALKARTEAIARHLSKFLADSNAYDKTIVFCVDQEHASEMRAALTALNPEIVSAHPDYVCRVTSDEGHIGKGHLAKFQDIDSLSPAILTTSKLLTTGVDAPTVKNVVIARVVSTMTEFKQIIGRGTRVRDDYNKLWFNIIDYTGSATRLFADSAFDGDPTRITTVTVNEDGDVETEVNDPLPGRVTPSDSPDVIPAPEDQRRKLYFDGGHIEVVAGLVYELGPDGSSLSVVQYSQYAGTEVRKLYPTPPELAAAWTDRTQRIELTRMLAERGVDFDSLANEAGMPDADPFDLLCHAAFNAPLRSRRERASRLRSDHHEFFAQYGEIARRVLEALLEKYATFGEQEFMLPDALKVSPLVDLGKPAEIAGQFGGIGNLRVAIDRLQVLLYEESETFTA